MDIPASTKVAYSKQFIFDGGKGLNARRHNLKEFVLGSGKHFEARPVVAKEGLINSFERALGGTGQLNVRRDVGQNGERDASLPKLKLKLPSTNPARTTGHFFGVVGTGAKPRAVASRDDHKLVRPPSLKPNPASEPGTNSNPTLSRVPKRPKSGDTNVTKNKHIGRDYRRQDKP